MKPVLPIVAMILCAQSADARPLIDSHFNSGGCFVRDYSADHLARHPEQLVKYISLSISALDAPQGMTLLDVIVNLRGRPEYFHGLAYCEPDVDTLACGMEGDAGAFRLEGAKAGALRLSLADQGLSFEGQTEFITLDGQQGDDRVFLIPSAKPAMCQ